MDTVECNLEEYQNFVANVPQPTGNEFKFKDQLFLKGYWAASQMNCEASEVLELYEKSLRKDTELDPKKVLDECGDVLWGITCILNTLGLTLDEAIAHNTSKLSERHGIAKQD